MFTGIINYQGTITSVAKNKNGATMTIQAPVAMAKRLKIGSSVSCNGVCLTVIKKTVTKRFVAFTVFLMNETLRLTSFAHVTTGDTINLEPSLRLGDEIGGHFVFGHVDGLGVITSLKPDGDSMLMTLKLPNTVMRHVAYKGSLGVEGISLTIMKVTRDTVSFSLIPHTMKVTNLRNKKPGNTVNVEIDMLARYAKKI